MAGNWLGAARTFISSIKPTTWFSALQPYVPMAPPGTAGRQYDYQVGQNLVITTRPAFMLPYAQLRAMAENCDILRLVIETRKDQVAGLEWEIVPKDPDKREEGIKSPRAKEIEAFFKKPDRIHSWDTWIRALLEDMFVVDAATIYKRRDNGGGLYSLDLMDGTLIKVLIDDHGRVPEFPDPAYQQLIKGLPAVDYTTDELIYKPRVVRTWSVYGFPPVEQIRLTIDNLLNRATFNANYYRDGNQPDIIATLPAEMLPEQVVAFQKAWDAIMRGNLVERRGIKFIPGSKGTKIQEIKEPPFKNEFDEWLARIVCYAFSVPPTPFIKQMNRATADTSQETALSEGLGPILRWVKEIVNEVIEIEFQDAEHEFAWKQKEEQNLLEAAQIRKIDTDAGIITRDEARESIGLEPMGGAASELGVVTATGFTPLDMSVEQGAAQLENTKNPPPVVAAPAGGKPPVGGKTDMKKRVKKKSLYRSTR